MSANVFSKKLVAIAIATALSTPIMAVEASTYHKDHRNSLKLDVAPIVVNKKNLKGGELTRHYLINNQSKYQLNFEHNDYRLTKVKTSLLAKHYHYQQYINDIPVDRAEVVVSVSSQNQITKVYNNTYPLSSKLPVTKNTISESNATEKVWSYLQVAGKLQGEPSSTLTYVNLGNKFKLAYKVNMAVSKPLGDWEFYLDVVTGEVFKSRKIDLPIHKNTEELSKVGKWPQAAIAKNLVSYQQALLEYRQMKQMKQQQQVNKADATALVFDPDPVTTLNDDTLEDTSAASMFEGAYETRTLKDLTLTGGTYSFTGPWVTIGDFESPATAPSTSTTGNWTAKRGDNAFNDAMTYFHIDQNQRYMQSLGFTGATGIQFNSIEVDTDGVDGTDNSHFLPSTNQLAFGHGCVDDNEDADVILHEYGHAINFSINSNFSGGDTGAMGEGFGDYWAASYSYTTPNGLTSHPEFAFSWDGHNACWGGRRLDQTSFRYDPTQTYGAHATVGGILSDELWSTPLAQSLLQLMNAGIPRSEVDQIILEAQFGLGSGLTMPDMATSIVSAAQALFPAGEHASIFESNFKLMEILGESLKLESVDVTAAGTNLIADPGETVTFDVTLKNSGVSAISSLSTSLSTSSAGVTVVSGESAYSDLATEQESSNTTPFQISIPNSHSCGENISLSLNANYSDGSAQSSDLEFVIPVGQGNLTSASSSPALSIPDDNVTGVTDIISLAGSAANSTISVDVNISHTYRGDLELTLTSPAGTSIILKSNSNDSTADLVGNYPETLTPTGDLSVFNNESHDGDWSLKIVDTAAQDLGTLNSWTINSTSAAICNANSAPDANVDSASIDATEGENVVLDATSSSDSDGDPLSYSWTQISGESVTINNSDSAQANIDTPSVVQSTTLVFQVTVSDDKGASDTALVEVNVAEENGNRAPVASVSSANIVATQGDSVSLDASTSSDPDGDSISFEWTQTSGNSIALSGANSSSASFSADTVGSYEFTVLVTDSIGATDTESVLVTVNSPNRAPVASVSTTTPTVNEGAGVNMSAAASSDPDSDNLTYAWSQTSGPTVTLSSTTNEQVSFTAPQVTASASLEFSMIVSDPSGETDTASVSITVNNVEEESSSGGGGSLGWMSLLLVAFFKRRK